MLDGFDQIRKSLSGNTLRQRKLICVASDCVHQDLLIGKHFCSFSETCYLQCAILSLAACHYLAVLFSWEWDLFLKLLTYYCILKIQKTPKSSSTNFANNNLFYFLIIFDHNMTHNCQPTKPNLQMF